MTNTIADYFAKILIKNSVKKVFIYPGGTIAPLINACIKRGIEIEVFKSEQGAAYAALAFSKISGKAQVVMVTSGPGVTNALTPLADSYYDSIPIILVTGQISTLDLNQRKSVRQRGFQEVPTVSLTKPISKHSSCLMSEEVALKELTNMFEITTQNRHGPVVIDFPMDIQKLEITKNVFENYDLNFKHFILDENKNINLSIISEIALEAMSAQRPVILLGNGALQSGKFEIYKKIADKIEACVVTSLLGIGCYDTLDDRWLGYIGHTGHMAANLALHESDFVIALGARLDVRQTGTVVDHFVPNGKVVWINNDLSELENPRVKVDWKINIDAGIFSTCLLNQLRTKKSIFDINWIKNMQKLRDQRIDDKPKNESKLIQPRLVLEVLSSFFRSDKTFTIVTGVGCHQQWAARHMLYAPGFCNLLTSGGHGAMGYDIPSAIGASMATPNKRIVCIVGDGSFLMNIQELAALSERNLDVKILILNNNRLGIVSQFQLISWGEDPTTGYFHTPDFASVSRGFGIVAETLQDRDEIRKKIEWLWAQNGPAVLNVIIDPAADVEPMLLGGQKMNEMWMGRK